MFEGASGARRVLAFSAWRVELDRRTGAFVYPYPGFFKILDLALLRLRGAKIMPTARLTSD